MNTEIIRNRKSVRTYKEQAIPEKILDQVRDYLEQDTGLFHVPVAFSVLSAPETGVSSPVILGEDTYVAGKYKKQKNAGCMCRTALFYLPEHANEHDRTGKQY